MRRVTLDASFVLFDDRMLHRRGGRAIGHLGMATFTLLHNRLRGGTAVVAPMHVMARLTTLLQRLMRKPRFAQSAVEFDVAGQA